MTRRVIFLLAVLLAAPALAGEGRTVTVTPVDMYIDQTIKGYCVVLEESGPRRYVTCDDVTSRETIEALFRYGKDDRPCEVDITPGGRAGEGESVVVHAVRDAS